MGERFLRQVWRFLAMACLSPSVLALEAHVDGLDHEPAKGNVITYLEAIEGERYSRNRLAAVVRRRSAEALRVYGYYEPQFAVELEGDPVDRVNVTIDPGPRVTVTELDIGVSGDAENDDTFQEALAGFPLQEGDPLEHAPYDRLRNRLSALALERGYFDSQYRQRRMEIRPWEASARLYLLLDSGPRYRFGEVNYQGSHIDEDRLRRMQPFDTETPYLAGDLATFNQRLGQSEWFSSISVRPRIRQGEQLAIEEPSSRWWEEAVLDDDPAAAQPRRHRLSAQALISANDISPRQSHDVPIDVRLAPADRHQFETAIGYATDVGPRVRFSWDQPWINSDGDSLDHDLFLSAPEQRLTGEYVMPLEDPLRDSYRLQYGFRQRDSEDTNSLEAAVELARRWEFDNGWTQSLYFRTLYEDFTQADQEDQVLLYYPGISWSRTRTRNPTFPSWGDRQRLAIEYSDSTWGSDATFLRATLDSQWIRMVGDDLRLVGRTGVGAIDTDDFDKIPPSLRFFTGGDRSIRGYSYESLAPRNDEGELRGGQHMFTASAEVQRRITGDWWGAAFTDTGNAFDSWWPDTLNTGAGLGVRWISPVGPIRLDIAHPFDDEDDSWRIHFAIGPEF
ncbi:autotransporter assembly complex protein TamA [Aidingimonas halophila]|uniref:Translocation and assembly module subunit TamA n=1 Tax=Aidingimonas halophila TaxID=574349 RepID=A0A1H3BNP5_9GAMM|nr:autotransporter assembly complex family protein [Aidingimonas halophila]GHC26868.1 outer membrane protein assembly factor [Aidingimonas halophila]SDX43467.1 autotransporter secretion outer membrane protein TamA [Aidingimonas halophila]